MDRKSQLTEALRISTGLSELFNSELFQKNLLPYLEKLSNVPYVAPRIDQTDEQYMFELRVANIKAGAYAEFLNFMKSQSTRMKQSALELKKLELRDGE